MRRQARLFAIADLLRARRSGITAEELADRFGVAVRTIYRDLETLRDAALPLNAERGRGGGYSLDRAYTLPPLKHRRRRAPIHTTQTSNPHHPPPPRPPTGPPGHPPFERPRAATCPRRPTTRGSRSR